MRHPSRSTALLLLLFAINGTAPLYADQVVDNTFDNDQNDLEYYWYYSDDNAGVGPNDRPQLFPGLKPSVINVPYDSVERHAFGDTTDAWMIKKYTFQTTTSFGRPCATMPFTFGDPWEAGYCSAGKNCAMPFVGIGTQLIHDGGAMDLRGVTSLGFKIKSRVNTLTEVSVRIQTLDIDLYADKPGSQMAGDEFGYYQSTFTVEPGDWQEVTVPLSDLSLPGTWAYDFEFDTTRCTKISWEVKGDGKITGDTLDIADVVLIGNWNYVSSALWMKTETASPTAGFFTNFDMAPFNQGPPLLNSYWFAYNDADIGGTSTVTEQYAALNAVTGKLDLNLIEQTGSDGKGRAAVLEYILGDPVMKDSTSIAGFVGIGINLYDSVKCTYWNADSAAADGVYFEYYTDAGAKCLTFELSDSNDVGDLNHPTRKEKRGSGIVYYRNFPPTNGEWRKVLLPFDSLVVHDRWEGYTAIPFDRKAVAKAQWKVQGAKGISGVFAIDRIFFPEGEYGQVEGIRSRRFSAIRNPVLDISTNGGCIRVNVDNRAHFSCGTVSLVNMKGTTITRTAVAPRNVGPTGLPTGRLPAGIYLVRFNAVDAWGNPVDLQRRVSVIR